MKNKKTNIMYMGLIIGGIIIIVTTILQVRDILTLYAANIIRIGIVLLMQIALCTKYLFEKKKTEFAICSFFVIIFVILLFFSF